MVRHDASIQSFELASLPEPEAGDDKTTDDASEAEENIEVVIGEAVDEND